MGVRLLLDAIIVFYCLAGTTLIREVREVFLALDRSLEEGRRQVSRIVGRDTSSAHCCPRNIGRKPERRCHCPTVLVCNLRNTGYADL